MLKILIVEDDLISAKELALQLQLHNCEVISIAPSAEQAIQDFDTHEPHLVFIDINLQGDKDGIAVAEHINNVCRVPFIYLSDNFGKTNPYFKRATATMPASYLPKGSFLPSMIWHFVDLALDAYNKAGGFYLNENETNMLIRNQIFVKTNATNTYEKLDTTDITHLVYNRPYTDIYRNNDIKKAIIRIRKSIDFTIEQLNAISLVRIHKSHAVNVNAIASYNPTAGEVVLNNNMKFDVGRVFKARFEEKIKLIG
jgi:two-component system, response regulator PdtaR